jgi:hypothetical protein
MDSSKGIPIGLPTGKSNQQTIDSDTFKKKIIKPLLKKGTANFY